MFFDLDHFKKVNDSLGHTIGDSLIIETANRIKECLRDGDTAARIGGDEFVILLPQLPNNDSSYTIAEKVADKIRESINKQFLVEQYDLKTTVSIGISIFMGKNESYEDILRHADMAMYRAKSDGRNTVRFFLPSMQAEVVKRLNLEKDLNNAFENQELYLCYQPQYTVDGKIFGVETLIRWIHPKHGNISPIDFISAAEDIGLIVPISEWVLKQSIIDMRSIVNLSRKHIPIRLSVNLSPHQFRQTDFIESIRKVIVENDFPTDLLTLEITENVIIENIEDTIKKFIKLKELGIQISLDDFGTGYSSLGYLKRLPINELKIDKSFVQDIETDKNDAILVETIISMAHHLKLKIVAEGVETKEQLNFLKRNKCDAYQGYYFSKPLAIYDFSQLYIESRTNSKSA